MRKIIKLFLALIAVLFVLATIAALVLIHYADPSRLKDKIAQEITQNTAYTTTIGSMKWSFWPFLHLQLHDVVMQNPTGFPATTFATIGNAEAEVKLSGLLDGEINVTRVHLEHLQLNLVKLKSGTGNWQRVNKSDTVTASTPKANTEKSNTNFSLNKLNVKAISLNDIRINWQDDTKNITQHFNVAQFQSKHINLQGEQFPLLLVWDYKNATLAKPLPFEISAVAAIDKDEKSYSLSEMKISVNNQIEVNGQIQYALNEAQPLRLNLQMPTTNIADFLHTIGYQNKFANKSALTQVAGSLNAIGSKDNLQISNFTLLLDGATVNTQANLTQLQPLVGTYTLTADKLNISDYQAAPATSKAKSNNTATSSSRASQLVTLPTWAKQANLAGKISVDNLQMGKLQAQNVQIPSLILQNAIINLSQVTATLYQGMFQGSLNANFNAAAPHYTITAKVNNIDVDSILSQLNNLNHISGTAAAAINVKTSGVDKTSLLKNAVGNGNLQINNGVYTGFNIINTLTTAASIFYQQAPIGNNQASDIAFSTVQADFNVNNGNLNLTKGNLTSPNVLIDGEGNTNLITQTLDYQLDVKAQGNIPPQVIKLQNDIGGSIPLKLTGTFNQPQLSPDMTKISLRATKETVNKNLDKVGNALDKAGKDVGKALNKLFH